MFLTIFIINAIKIKPKKYALKITKERERKSLNFLFIIVIIYSENLLKILPQA